MKCIHNPENIGENGCDGRAWAKYNDMYKCQYDSLPPQPKEDSLGKAVGTCKCSSLLKKIRGEHVVCELHQAQEVQNTSKEKMYQKFWKEINQFYFAEIEAAENKKYEQGFIDGKKKAFGVDRESVLKEGRQSAFTQVREKLRLSIKDWQAVMTKEEYIIRKSLLDDLAQLQESSK